MMLPATLVGQGQTETRLNDGIKFYQNLQTGQARDVFHQVLSPGWQFEVSRDQRVRAYKYLGAVLATEGQKDSAQVYFRAALERDPFTDLDLTFSPQERQAFAESKLKVFKVGVKPLVADTLDPKTGHITLSVITTHASTLSVQVVGDSEPSFPLFAGDNDALRPIQWNGTNLHNTLVAGGAYEIHIVGRSNIDRAQADSVVLYFDLQHLHAPLADTIATIRLDQLLPTRYPESSARNTLLLGLGVATAAIVIPQVVGYGGSASAPKAPAIGISALGFITGVMGFVNRQNHPEIPENVAENDRRLRKRAADNAVIQAANDAKLGATRLVITPIVLAGTGQ
ncbi:MAG TPA: tetratricopeptide repeat protein [Gemmatimonadales bacterium]|jgi:hypothetical protein